MDEEHMGNRADQLKAYKCTQCGAHDLNPMEDGRLKCGYCAAVFAAPKEMQPHHSQGPHVIIGGNANVIIGSKGHVTVRGGLAVEGHAKLQVDGELILEEPGDSERQKK
jgi:hypothetical protein